MVTVNRLGILAVTKSRIQFFVLKWQKVGWLSGLYDLFYNPVYISFDHKEYI